MYALIGMLVLAIAAQADLPETHKPGHFRLENRTGTRYVTLRATLSDSLRATNVGDGQHVQNDTRFSLLFHGQLHPQWSFHSYAEATTEKGNQLYPDHFYDPYDGLPYNPQQGRKTRTYDVFTARTDWKSEWLGASFGIDHLQWGPARRNKLVLRGNDFVWRPWHDSTQRLVRPAPIVFLGFDMTLGPITYTQYSGLLQHEKSKRKYIHAHRLDLTLPASINFGVTESILYGTTVEPLGSNPNQDAENSVRKAEPLYVLPFVPYLFAQHYVGDRDNVGMSADISIRTLPGWEFYAELFWDDMKAPLDMLDDSWWGNKWALSAGAATDNRSWGPLDWSWMLEYTRIEPWVYTHHLGAGYRYTHFNQNLGSDLGPNSQEIYTQLDLGYSALRLSLHTSSVARDSARGGNISDIHVPEYNYLGMTPDRTDKTFLDPATTRRYQEYGAALQWTPVHFWWLRYGQRWLRGDYRGYRLEVSSGVTW